MSIVALGGPPPYHVVGLELEIIRFYHAVFLEEIRLHPALNQYFVQLVKNAYCKWIIENGLSNISFEHPAARCAYVFLNAPCASSTTAYHFFHLVQQNPWLIRKILFRGELSVCCLGGGPAPELVGILKILQMVLARCDRPSSVTVSATVVDIDPGWRQTIRWMTQNWWKHFDSKIVKLRVAFLQSDLTRPLSDEVRETVRSSDIVTMVKFLSAVCGTKGIERIPTVVQGITECMPVGGVLFSINCTRVNCDEALQEVMSSNRLLTMIFGPIHCHPYKLSGPAEDEYLRFFFRFYGWQPPCLENRNHVTAWLKHSSISTEL